METNSTKNYVLSSLDVNLLVAKVEEYLSRKYEFSEVIQTPDSGVIESMHIHVW